VSLCNLKFYEDFTADFTKKTVLLIETIPRKMYLFIHRQEPEKGRSVGDGEVVEFDVVRVKELRRRDWGFHPSSHIRIDRPYARFAGWTTEKHRNL